MALSPIFFAILIITGIKIIGWIICMYGICFPIFELSKNKKIIAISTVIITYLIKLFLNFRYLNENNIGNIIGIVAFSMIMFSLFMRSTDDLINKLILLINKNLVDLPDKEKASLITEKLNEFDAEYKTEKIDDCKYLDELEKICTEIGIDLKQELKSK